MKNNTFSVQQLSIIIGSLLGDGHLTNQQYGNSAFMKNQCISHNKYLEWHFQQFGSMSCPIKTYSTTAKNKLYYRNTFRVKSHPFFSKLRQKWYPNGKKIIPHDLILDPLTLSIWYFDDGSNVLAARRISFATYCFSKSDVQFLSDLMLKNFNIKCYTSKKNVLIVRAESYKTMVNIVRPYMLWPCFHHKILYRDSLSSPSCKKDIDKVISLYHSNKTVKEIANIMNVSEASIYNQLRVNRTKLDKTPAHLALNNTSGLKGICFDKSRNKWLAYLYRNNKRIRIGRFKTIQEAQNALKAILSS